MSFANMVDEYLDSNDQPLGAPLQQILFTKDNQMAGDQCSEPSQSGGSYQSGDPAGVVPSSAEKQVPK